MYKNVYKTCFLIVKHENNLMHPQGIVQEREEETERDRDYGSPIQNPTTDCLAYRITGDPEQTQAHSAGPDPVPIRLIAGSPKAEEGFSAYLRNEEVLSFSKPLVFRGLSEALEKSWSVPLVVL